ncbi:hypothetical protein [Qipengyuania nanhaisediminis]|uniref:hypothetical protein n=1 Tax=Qipengyuania nanhaisediminis TaxID=604088 RepID=UPI0038B2E4BF
MTTQFTEIAQRAAADGDVTADEVLALRRQGWGDGIITREEAEAIFAVNNAIDERSQEWCDFVVEAIGEFVLNGTEPRLQCDDSEAEWLIAQVDHDGVCESYVELEVIVRIIERAENVPTRLKDYVIAQVENEVLTGTGPTRHGGELSDTHVSSAEARILRRVVFASGGHGPAAVSRHEAEMLFRLKDATKAEANAPEWDDLFLDGVANFMRGFAFQNAQLDHSRRRGLEEFMADDSANVGRFLGRMAKQVPHVRNHFGKVFGKKDAGPSIADQAATGHEVTDFEQQWLDKMIEGDGEVDDLERRLIARIIEEGE